jgi:hypothetical protein
MIKNFSSRLRDINGRRDIGGNKISDTSELTTEVKAVAILRTEEPMRGKSLPNRDQNTYIKPTATSNTLSRRMNWRKPVHALLTLRLIVEGVCRNASRASSAATHNACVDIVDDVGVLAFPANEEDFTEGLGVKKLRKVACSWRRPRQPARECRQD